MPTVGDTRHLGTGGSPRDQDEPHEPGAGRQGLGRQQSEVPKGGAAAGKSWAWTGVQAGPAGLAHQHQFPG